MAGDLDTRFLVYSDVQGWMPRMDPLATAGWNMRQPEIDELRAENHRLSLILARSDSDEEAQLRAEVERWKEAQHAQLVAYETANRDRLELQAEVERLRMEFHREHTEHAITYKQVEDENERLRALLEPIQAERDELRSEVITLEWSLSEATKAAERFQAALKVHHDLGLWSLGHEICPECRQAC